MWLTRASIWSFFKFLCYFLMFRDSFVKEGFFFFIEFHLFPKFLGPIKWAPKFEFVNSSFTTYLCYLLVELSPQTLKMLKNAKFHNCASASFKQQGRYTNDFIIVIFVQVKSIPRILYNFQKFILAKNSNHRCVMN